MISANRDQLTIALFTDTPTLVGGAEQQMTTEAELLESEGHEVSTIGLASQREEEHQERIPDYEIPVSGPESIRILSQAAVHPGVYRRLRQLLSELDPNIIHLHKTQEHPAAVLLACRGYPTVKTHHDFKTVCPSGWAAFKDTHEICPGGPGPKCVRHDCRSAVVMGGFYAPYYAAKIPLEKRYVDYHIAPSERLTRYLHRFGYNVRRLPNPAPDPPIGKNRERDDWFLFVGRLEEPKGIHVLIDAIDHIDERVSVRIVGGGPMADDLERTIEERGLQNEVELLGYVDRDALWDLYRRASAVVIPSIWMENFPTVALESLAVGCPVIGSDRGGIPEIVADGERGFIYKATDHEALANRMLRFHQDPDLAERFGQNGRKYVRSELTEANFLERLLETFHRAIEKQETDSYSFPTRRGSGA